MVIDIWNDIEDSYYPFCIIEKSLHFSEIVVIKFYVIAVVILEKY